MVIFYHSCKEALFPIEPLQFSIYLLPYSGYVQIPQLKKPALKHHNMLYR